MENYVSVRVKTLNGTAAVNQALHDTRERPPSYLEGDPNTLTLIFNNGSDPQKRKNAEAYPVLRKELDESKVRQNKHYQQKKGRKRPSNAKSFISGIITFSNTENSNLHELSGAALTFLKKFCERYDCKPLYITFHGDEATPHFHFQIENLTSKAMSVRRQLTRQALSNLQDLAGETFAHLGFVRGQKTEKPRKHYSVREGHVREIREAAELSQKIVEQKVELEELREALTAEKEKCDEMKRQVHAYENQIQEMQEEIKKRKRERAEYIAEIQRMEDNIKQRKTMYREYDTKTKKIREKRDSMLEEAQGLKKYIMKNTSKTKEIQNQIQTLQKFLAYNKSPVFEKELALRDIFCKLVKDSKLKQESKTVIYNTLKENVFSTVPDIFFRDICECFGIDMEKYETRLENEWQR